MNEAELTINVLMYFILPLWLLAGFADWLCHRASNIATTSGPKESMIHLLMFVEMAIPVTLAMQFEINALVLWIMLVCLIVHEVTAVWDVAYAGQHREVSPIEQHVRSFSVLPLDVSNIRESAAAGSRAPRDIEIPAEDERLVYLFEPDVVSLCNDLLSRYLASEMFRAILENVASEFGARMTAMDSATENAADLISRLTLEYNRARQASITKEILEVAGGAEAMKESA